MTDAISGTCADRFQPVLDAFRANFAERGEVGASVCIVHRGETVVDLWGGIADRKTGRAWERDTVSIVFSCTKGATALCAHMLCDQGALALHDKVGKLWPAFATHGKEDTTLAHMLAHTSPVPHVRAAVRDGGYMDWDYMIGRMAEEPAWWHPGERQGYHGVTYAWTVGQMVRLAAGEPLGAFFKRNVADRLGLDFHIGNLPEAAEARVAGMIASDPAEVDFASKFFHDVTQVPGSLPQLFLMNNGSADFNSRGMHVAELGSANGITNARGLAGMYAPLATRSGLLKSETIDRIGRASACTHDDATLRQPMRFGLGYMLSTDNRGQGDSLLLGERGFGHVGMGGSIGFADTEAEFSFGYTMNRMGAGILLNARGQSLVDAAYRALGYTSDASGAWRT